MFINEFYRVNAINPLSKIRDIKGCPFRTDNLREKGTIRYLKLSYLNFIFTVTISDVKSVLREKCA